MRATIVSIALAVAGTVLGLSALYQLFCGSGRRNLRAWTLMIASVACVVVIGSIIG